MTLNRLLSYLPSKLPVGVTEFDKWADSIIKLAGPFADADSMKFAIASIVIHLPPTRSSIPKAYFVKSLRKSAANQVASQVFQDIKQKQMEAAKAVQEAAQLAEATAKAQDEQQVVSNESQS